MDLLPFRTPSRSIGYRTRAMTRKDLIVMEQIENDKIRDFDAHDYYHHLCVESSSSASRSETVRHHESPLAAEDNSTPPSRVCRRRCCSDSEH